MATAQILVSTPTSRFWVVENFLPEMCQHVHVYTELQKLLLLHNPPIVVFGKPGVQHRDIGFFSDVSIGYKYSNQMIGSQPLSSSPILKPMLDYVNQSLNTQFNAILVNKYKDGSDYIGAHSDELDEGKRDAGAETALSVGGIVAGISYGPATRTFRITDKKSGNLVLNYQHKPRTLIVMDGQFQKEFKHGIPQEKSVTEERISLTFRCHTK